MDPLSLSGLIVAIISVLGVAILGICKVIKQSSCCWGGVDIETRNMEVTERTNVHNNLDT